ncbi:MAG: hypothetical protein NC191_10050 [Muribaculaceae bacterium]|nr:hypothetical protein [Muribaculaceae bacterium]
MQVSPVSIAFEGKGKKKAQKQVVITPEQFASFDDRQLGVLSRALASEKVNDKKHRRINNALWYSLPVVGGFAEAARVGAHVAPWGARIANFASGAGMWTATLLGISAISAGLRAVENHSAKVREFKKNNPGLAMLGSFGTIVAGLSLGGSALVNGVPKLLRFKPISKLHQSAYETVDGLLCRVDSKPMFKNLSSMLAKVPSPIKSATKTMAKYAPMVLIAAQFGHLFNHLSTKNRVTMDTFAELKEAQKDVRQQLAAERAEAAEEV